MEIAKKLFSSLRKERIHLVLDGDSNLEIISYDKNISPEILQKLKANKSILVAYLKSKNSQSDSIPLAEKSEYYPLSSSQKRLWIVAQFEGNPIAYNMPSINSLEDVCDIPSFEKAVYSVIERHEILRTVFMENEDNESCQYITPYDEFKFEIDFIDLREYEDRNARLDKYVEDDKLKAFDLKNGPLFRACLFRLEDKKNVFYFNMHHIISDGWSMDILAKDVFTYYEAYKAGTTPKLPELKLQYKDYSAWQQMQLETPLYENHKTYWMDKLSGEIPILDLPSQKVRPAIKTYNGFTLQTFISSDVTQKLNAFTRKNGGSLFMGALSVFKVLLHKYTTETDITIGTPVAGRDQFGLEDQIGFYLNVLVLRNQILPEDSFNSIFDKVKNSTMVAFEHQAYPFDQLDLDVEYNLSRNSVFDISFTYNSIIDYSGVGPLEQSKIDAVESIGPGTCKNDIEIHFDEVEDYLSFKINFNTDVYEKEMMIGFMKHFKKMLSNLLKDSNKQIAAIDYLADDYKNKLLVDFNDTKVDFPKDTNVLNLFREQVKKSSDKTAVVFKDKKLSYQELDEMSNNLAHCLKERFAIKPSDTVGIELARSEWVIVSILAIYKVGAAYVSIDANMPNSRKEFIINDTKIKLLITEANNIFDLDYFDGTILTIDLDYDASKYSNLQLETTISEEDLAYVIYTSGSTGKPKGIIVNHKSLTASIQAKNHYYENLNSHLMIPSFAFDASIGLMWNALTTGAELYLPSDMEIKDPDQLIKILIENKVELLASVPSYYNLLLKSPDFKNNSLKSIIIGGESYNKTLVDTHFEINESCSLFNEYGPTENTIWASVFQVTKGFDKNSIGKPIANNQIYILNTELQLVPVGVIGEIAIGGANLSEGYLNLPELTKEKFIGHPFEKGRKIYRTGDFARWLPDGNIEFIGRKDRQVKIRGLRMEIGEIEYKLQSKDGIVDSIVKAEMNNHDNLELVAYFVSDIEQNMKELRDFLFEELPEYMIPAVFVKMDSFPLTPNGKVDKQALSVEDGVVMNAVSEYVAPTSEKEKLIVSILEEVLNVDKIGMLDNFYKLGGDSLKSINFITLLKQHGYSLEMTDFVRNPIVIDFMPLISELEEVAVA